VASRTYNTEADLTKEVIIELDGKRYVWNGRIWYTHRTFQAPPAALVAKLNERLASVLASEDAKVTDFNGLLQIARIARDASQFRRAESAARRAIELQPSSEPAFAILCSLLRHLGASDRAVQETEHLRSPSYQPLLVSRAAALCDLGRWEEAKATLGRALAQKGSPEAFEVVNRIKANRPDLYEDRARKS
jgi:tetratricopeptide (TPR) repeat protein